MTWLKQFLSSSIGLKIVMALSGLGLFGFVIAHMLGNLQVFLGAEKFNAYAAMMQGNPLLWPARIGLLGMIFAHMGSAAALVLRSNKARPTGYKSHQWLSGSYAVRTMRFGGLVLLAFIVYHLLHMTVGTAHGEFRHCMSDGAGGLTCFAYQNLVSGLMNPAVASAYIVAQVALGLHLAHGVWSLCRTLGLGNPRYDLLARRAALSFGGLITAGNCAIAIAIVAGLVKLP